jgi:ribosomal protein S18/ribosomal protein S6
MIQNYELYLVLNPELSNEQIETEIANIQKLVSQELGAESLTVTPEGLKKLAYPISKHTTGFYTMLNFEIHGSAGRKFQNVEKKLNITDSVLRYLLLNQTDFFKQKAKENKPKVEVTNHRELNKGKTVKKDINAYLGLKVIDYKEVDYLNQFTSPYAKIFARTKTGTSAKFQRKINQAIKRARHMALMPFTPKHM